MTARVGLRLLLLQARWDPARMQGTGLAFALEPWLAECWAADAEGLRAARVRHLEYFNTHPAAAWLVAGIVCRMEKEAAAASGAEREAVIAKIRALKTRLGATLAGVYDPLFWGGLRPVSALAGLLVAQFAFQRNGAAAVPCGVAAALLAYNVPAFAARFAGLRRGYRDGEAAVTALARVPVQTWIRGLRVSVVAGALLSASYGIGLLDGGDRMVAGLTFAAGLVLARFGVTPLAQLGIAGAGGMAASFMGVWP